LCHSITYVPRSNERTYALATVPATSIRSRLRERTGSDKYRARKLNKSASGHGLYVTKATSLTGRQQFVVHPFDIDAVDKAAAVWGGGGNDFTLKFFKLKKC